LTIKHIFPTPFIHLGPLKRELVYHRHYTTREEAVDEHVRRAVVQGLRERGVDIKTVTEAGLLSAPMPRARAEQRVIFTQDSDFLRLHAAGHPHCGIVYASQGTSIRETIHGLM